MISLLHGIIDSKPFVAIYGCTDPSALNYNPSANIDNGSCEYPGVFTLTLNRTTIPIFGPFGGAEPITPGTGYNYPVPTYNPGVLHFDVSVSGDTSSIAEYGIVSATFASPTYSSSPQLINSYIDFQNPTNGFTYSVSSPELRYYRAYALNYTGDYYYSSGPGILFQMEKIDFPIVYYSEGGPGLGSLPYDITIVARLVDPVGTVSEAGFYINQGGISFEPQYDPYWSGATGVNITTSTASISSNQFSYFIENIGGFDDQTLYLRAFAVYGGQRYWSQLQILFA
jgi:hypothetical protein